jgi:ribosomal protein S18 acetylase RimI-like enzyme
MTLIGRVNRYHSSYAQQISQLFHLSVSQINHPRYNSCQLNAWSSAPRSAKHWQNQLKRKQTWLFIEANSGLLLGFISLDTSAKHQGYIEHLYVQPKFQSQGIAQSLYEQAAIFAKEQGYSSLSCDASYVSKAFFERQGFEVKQKSFQSKLGQVITGFDMLKNI